MGAKKSIELSGMHNCRVLLEEICIRESIVGVREYEKLNCSIWCMNFPIILPGNVSAIAYETREGEFE